MKEDNWNSFRKFITQSNCMRRAGERYSTYTTRLTRTYNTRYNKPRLTDYRLTSSIVLTTLQTLPSRIRTYPRCSKKERNANTTLISLGNNIGCKIKSTEYYALYDSRPEDS